MADGDPKPIRVTVISDSNDPSPPQGIYAINTLTPLQLAALRARIREARAKLRIGKETRSFSRAVLWVYNVFGYDVNLDSNFVPLPSYGATFENFVEFVFRKERDAEAEEVVENEEGDQRE
jgi:hypothetical protein